MSFQFGPKNCNRASNTYEKWKGVPKFGAKILKLTCKSLRLVIFDIVYFVGTMKKVKFRTKYQYTGRRKNANLS